VKASAVVDLWCNQMINDHQRLDAHAQRYPLDAAFQEK